MQRNLVAIALACVAACLPATEPELDGERTQREAPAQCVVTRWCQAGETGPACIRADEWASGDPLVVYSALPNDASGREVLGTLEPGTVVAVSEQTRRSNGYGGYVTYYQVPIGDSKGWILAAADQVPGEAPTVNCRPHD